MPNVIITPHYGGVHPGYDEEAFSVFCDNLRALGARRASAARRGQDGRLLMGEAPPAVPACWSARAATPTTTGWARSIPPGTARQDFLSLYAREFPVVELNFSYYQQPNPRTLERMVAGTPPGFTFALKAHRSMTHEIGGELGEGHRAAFRAGVQPLVGRRAARRGSPAVPARLRVHPGVAVTAGGALREAGRPSAGRGVPQARMDEGAGASKGLRSARRLTGERGRARPAEPAPADHRDHGPLRVRAFSRPEQGSVVDG